MSNHTNTRRRQSVQQQLIMVNGEKGGIGKTAMTRLLMEVHQRQSTFSSLHVIDSDTQDTFSELIKKTGKQYNITLDRIPIVTEDAVESGRSKNGVWGTDNIAVSISKSIAGADKQVVVWNLPANINSHFYMAENISIADFLRAEYPDLKIKTIWIVDPTESGMQLLENEITIGYLPTSDNVLVAIPRYIAHDSGIEAHVNDYVGELNAENNKYSIMEIPKLRATTINAYLQSTRFSTDANDPNKIYRLTLAKMWIEPAFDPLMTFLEA